MDLTGVRGILSDLDGVWFVGNQPVPGGADALTAIRERGLPIRFITNTTTRPTESIAEMLHEMGLDIPAGEIVTSSRATALYLAAKGNPTCRLYVSDAVRSEFAGLAESDRPDCVVIGDLGAGWNYELMNEAFGLIFDGAELVAMHRGRYWQTEAGITLDLGAIVAGLEYAAGVEATIVGKPARTMFDSALSDIGMGPGDVVMVGDDPHNDIAGAQAVGIRAVLVRTGKYREDKVTRSGVTPDAVIDSIGDLAAALPE
jgi:HAD superfamily hydrolase (TIGR01458 family)